MSETSSNNKRIAKNTLFLYFRMMFIMLITLYTSRVVLDKLGIVDYGINNVESMQDFMYYYKLIYDKKRLTSCQSFVKNYSIHIFL